MRTMHCVVTGRVQGVAFRWWTRDTAQALGVSGWVRNLPDGRVELAAQGADDTLERLRGLLWEGPALAAVERVECEERQSAEVYAGFEIRR